MATEHATGVLIMAYPYKLMLFPDDDEGPEGLSVDYVPTKWIFDSVELKSKACHFPAGPFSKKESVRFDKVRQNLDSADISWPIHRVEIRGRARTFEEAVELADKLRKEPYAFSTDRESSIERRFCEENGTQKNIQSLDDEFNEAQVVLNDDLTLLRKNEGRKSNKNNMKKTVSISSNSSSDSDDEPNHQSEQNQLEKSNTSPRSPQMEKSGSLRMKKDSATPARVQSTLESRNRSSSRDTSPEVTKGSQSKKSMQAVKASPLSSPEPSSSKRKGKQLKTGLSRPKGALVTPVDSPKTRYARKRTRSESSSSSDSSSSRAVSEESDVEHKKKHRRSRSKERRSSKKLDKSLQLSPELSDKNNNRTPPSIKRSSVFQRSQSAESSKKKSDHPKLKRARSSDDSHRSSSKNVPYHDTLPVVREEEHQEILESLKIYITKAYNSLSGKIDRLHGALVETDGNVDQLKNIIQKKTVVDAESDEDAEEDNQNHVHLPMNSKEDFAIFDARLKEDRNYRHKIKQRIRKMIPSKDYQTRNLSLIFQTFFTKTLVHEKLTALKKTATKDALKDTNFYKCLLEVHQNKLGDTMDERKFQSKLKSMFNSAGDWNGGRLERP